MSREEGGFYRLVVRIAESRIEIAQCRAHYD